MRLFKSLFLFWIILFSVELNGQNCNSFILGTRKEVTKTILCPEDMLYDVQKLRENLEDIHPDLYFYATKEVIDSAYRIAISKVSNELSAYEFGKTISIFLNSFRDSHTGFNLQSFLFLGPKNKGTLPFFLRKIGSKFYIESIYESPNLKGKELLAINNLKIEDIFKESMAFSIIEGSSVSAQEEIATKAMALVYSQMSCFKSFDSIKLKYIASSDTLISKIKATSKLNLFRYKTSSDSKNVSYFFNDENKGILKISSFQPKSIGLFKKDLAKFFKVAEERNCNEIFIDLRDNPGGFVKAQEYLISFLNLKNKSYEIEHVYKRSHLDPFGKMSHIKKMRFKQRAKRKLAIGINDDEYAIMKSEIGTVHRITYSNIPKNEHGQTYHGKCSLIINGLSMSASVLFASWFKDSKRGEIIGTPCLGSMNGTFGSSATIYLPNTGLPLMISTMKFNPIFNKKENTTPIIPDKLIEYTIEDLANDRDPVWNFLNVLKSCYQCLK